MRRGRRSNNATKMGEEVQRRSKWRKVKQEDLIYYATYSDEPSDITLYFIIGLSLFHFLCQF